MTFEIGAALHAKGFKIKFKLFGEKKYTETPPIDNSTNMKFNYSKIINYDSIDFVNMNLV